MQKTLGRIIVLYFLLPLVVAATVLPSIGCAAGSTTALQQDNRGGYPFLKWEPIVPLGAMTPETSGSIKSEYDVVVDVWQRLNSEYGVHISILSTAGSLATESKLKSYLTVTERTHVSSHGQYSSTLGPEVHLASGWLYKDLVVSWVLTSPKSDLLVLSACNSLGYDSHSVQTLAQQIALKSSVDMVLGYEDVVDSYSTIYFTHKFWWFMVSAAAPYGGFDGETSLDLAKTALFNHIEAIKAVASGGVAAVLAYIGNHLAGLPGGVVGAVLGEIAEEALAHIVLGNWITLQEQTLNSLDFYGVADVPALVWTGGGDPWGGDLPY